MSLDICLVSMPYAAAERPSIGLSLLQSALQASGHKSRILYANLAFAEQVGLPAHQLMCALAPEKLLGEWTFAAAAFPELSDSPGDIAEWAASVDPEGRLNEALGGHSLLDWLFELRRFAPIFIEHIANVVLATEPKVVGCTSIFQQHCASLALLRRIRQLNPNVVTILGGANCEGVMGQVVARRFPWVDVVVSGEADNMIVPLVEELLARGHNFAPERLPAGAITAAHHCQGPAPRARARDMDQLAIPNYDDYFRALAASPLASSIDPVLLMETSRGCWWGEVKHCTFCGLNGTGMGYRAKSSQRTLDELDTLARRYGLTRFEMVDNILDLDYFRSVMPTLRDRGAPYSMFYETKANLKREHLELLSRAGVHGIQPGIESLNDEALKAVEKGCTVMHNLQLLKWSREHRIAVTWSLLTGMPEEQDSWWAETAQWLELVEHLQPPGGVCKIHFQRFSPYHFRAEDFGLELAPSPVYRSLFPVPVGDLKDLAYYFEAMPNTSSPPAPNGQPPTEQPQPEQTPANSAPCKADRPRPGRQHLEEAVDRWIESWTNRSKAKNLPRLEMLSVEGEVFIVDTRRCAVASRHHLQGLSAELFLACDRARSARSLRRKYVGVPASQAAVKEEAFDKAIESLLERRLLLDLNGKLLALAVEVKATAPASLGIKSGFSKDSETAPLPAAADQKTSSGLSVEHEGAR